MALTRQGTKIIKNGVAERLRWRIAYVRIITLGYANST